MRAYKVRSVPRKKTNKVVFSARITEAEFQALEDAAARDGITMTELFRSWLRSMPTYRQPPVRPPHKGKE